MTYYHVSSYIYENQCLTQKTKNCRCFCEYISNCYARNYNEYKAYFDELKCYRLDEITGRDVSKWICEAIFDEVRKTMFLNYPSRIWGVYLIDSLEKACEFRKKYRDVNSAKIFEINVPEEDVFCFDMSIFTLANEEIRKTGFSFDSYNRARKLAELYWSGKVIDGDKELLIDRPVIVGRRVA